MLTVLWLLVSVFASVLLFDQVHLSNSSQLSLWRLPALEARSGLLYLLNKNKEVVRVKASLLRGQDMQEISSEDLEAVQISASGHTDKEAWYLLFQGSASNSTSVQVYVDDTVPLELGKDSPQVSVKNQEEVLYRLRKSDKSLFKQYEMLEIKSLSRCRAFLSVGFDKIPEVEMDDTGITFLTVPFVVEEPAESLYILVSFSADCSGFSFRIRKSENQVSVIEDGDLISVSKKGVYFFFSREKLRSIVLKPFLNREVRQNGKTELYTYTSINPLDGTLRYAPDNGSKPRHWLIKIKVLDEVQKQVGIFRKAEALTVGSNLTLYSTKRIRYEIKPPPPSEILCILPNEAVPISVSVSFPQVPMVKHQELLGGTCFWNLQEEPEEADLLFVSFQIRASKIDVSDSTLVSIPYTSFTENDVYFNDSKTLIVKLDRPGFHSFVPNHCDVFDRSPVSVPVYLTGSSGTRLKCDSLKEYHFHPAIAAQLSRTNSNLKVVVNSCLQDPQRYYTKHECIAVLDLQVLAKHHKAVALKFSRSIAKFSATWKGVESEFVYGGGYTDSSDVSKGTFLLLAAPDLNTDSSRYFVTIEDPLLHSQAVEIVITWIEESGTIEMNDSGYHSIASAEDPLLFNVQVPPQYFLASAHYSFKGDENPKAVYVGASGFEKPLKPLDAPVVLYRPSTAMSFYVLVYPHSEISLFVKGEATKHLCNPVIGCSGNGFCDAQRLNSQCTCIVGAGYGFSGDHCEEKKTQWMTLVASCIVILVVTVILLYLAYIRLFSTPKKEKEPESNEVGEDEKSSLHSALLSQSPKMSQIFSSLKDYVEPVSISLKDAQVSVRQNRQTTHLLSNVNLRMASGTLTAVMGPSGAGKSTLLQVLAGKTRLSEGSLALNDVELTRGQYRDLQLLSGYVYQDDILHPALTVYEHVLHSARMRLPASISDSVKKELVLTLLEKLGLDARKDFVAGEIGSSKLSGGQRRRLSIAIELASFPSVLFLDEPTSGLDSQASLSLIGLVKKVVVKELGINVIAVLHQPRIEILDLCDQIVLLNRGQVKYAGDASPSSLCPVFPPLVRALDREGSFFNVADMIIDHVEDFQWKQDPINLEDSEKRQLVLKSRPSIHAQFFYQLLRAFNQMRRSTSLVCTLYGLTLFVALILGFIFRSDRFIGSPAAEKIQQLCGPEFQLKCAAHQQDDFVSQASMITLSLGLVSATAALLAFGGIDKKMFERETRWGTSSITYYIAKELVAIPNLILAPFLFVAVFQLIAAPPLPIIRLWLLVVEVYFAAAGAAYFISIVCPDSRALIVCVVYIALMTALSGVSPSIGSLKRSLGNVLGTALTSSSFVRWSVESYYLSVLKTYENIYDVSWGLKFHEYSLDELHTTLIAPIIIGFILRTLAASALVVRAYRLKSTS